jgi:hypothetical protein
MRAGRTGETLVVPSELGPFISDLAPTPGGGTLLVGDVGSFSGSVPWVAKVDSGWELAWEITMGSPANEVAVLPDGSAVVAGSFHEEEGSAASGLSWARIDSGGNVVWDQSPSRFRGSKIAGLGEKCFRCTRRRFACWFPPMKAFS